MTESLQKCEVHACVYSCTDLMNGDISTKCVDHIDPCKKCRKPTTWKQGLCFSCDEPRHKIKSGLTIFYK